MPNVTYKMLWVQNAWPAWPAGQAGQAGRCQPGVLTSLNLDPSGGHQGAGQAGQAGRASRAGMPGWQARQAMPMPDGL